MEPLLLYLMLLALGVCLAQNYQVDLKPYFSDSEIKDLNLIADFFQNEFCGTTDRTKFGNCMTSPIPKLAGWEHKYLENKISWGKQKKLYSKISDASFSKIWRLSKSTVLLVEPKYHYNVLIFSYNRRFITFVRSLED